jgi:hypothetical protein
LKKILPFFSYVFHPVFIPLYGTLFYLFGTENYYEPLDKYLIVIQIVLITLLIPITFIYLLKIIGKVDSIMIPEVSQRKYPFFVQILLMLMLLIKSITIYRVPELFFFFTGGTISMVFAFVLLFIRVKASIHMIGICALTTFVIGLSLHTHSNWIFLIAALILTNGIVATSRLESKAHSGKELWIGFILGLLPQLILLRLWL